MVDESLPIILLQQKNRYFALFLNLVLVKKTANVFYIRCIEICYAFHYKCLDAFNCCSNEIEIATLFLITFKLCQKNQKHLQNVERKKSNP